MSKTSVLSRLRTYVRTSLSGEVHIPGFALLFLVFSMFHPVAFIVFVSYVVVFRKRMPWIVFVIALVVIPASLMSGVRNTADVGRTLTVTWIEETPYGERLTLSGEGARYHWSVPEDAYAIGDEIHVEGHVTPYRNRTVPGGFDEARTHLADGVSGYLDVETVVKTGDRFALYAFRKTVFDHVREVTEDPYVMRYLFDTPSEGYAGEDPVGEIGIAYLLSLSGLHLYALLHVLRKMMWALDLPVFVQKVLEVFLFIPFLYLTGVAAGVLRVFLSVIVGWIDRSFSLGLNRLDRLFVVFGVMIVIKPSVIFEPGLPVTFAILLALVLLEFRYRHLGSVAKGLVISLIASAVALPMVGSILFPLVLMMPAMVYLMSGPLLMIALASALMPFLMPFHRTVFTMLEDVLSWLHPRQIAFHVPGLPALLVVLAVFFVIGAIASGTARHAIVRALGAVMILFSPVAFRHALGTQEVIMADVGQGDGTVILTPSCTVVIDAYRNIGTILEAKGISTIDLLIISHSDDDHVREVGTLVSKFDIRRTVISPYDRLSVEGVRAETVRAGSILSCGSLKFEVLGPLTDHGARNDNALVVRTVVSGVSFLFTGDIGQAVEHELVMSYGTRLESDVLKVAHHGSSTSTSKAFLEAVDPSVAFISVGRSNRYGFPHEDALETLREKGALVHRTDTMGTLVMTSSPFGRKWSAWLPYDARFWYN
jgi:competence protein ComEC